MKADDLAGDEADCVVEAVACGSNEDGAITLCATVAGSGPRPGRIMIQDSVAAEAARRVVQYITGCVGSVAHGINAREQASTSSRGG